MIPKLVVTVALMAAQTALAMSRKIKGPRLDDLSVALADYGTPIPRFWGKRRIQPQIIWAEHLREKKVTSKTKGGKFQEYKYYGTWAVLICDHEIDSVSRIWLDKHLVYDLTSVGPISIGALFGNRDGVKLQPGKNYRVYDGTQTTPDPRIEDWCEDRYGAGTCPAYTGSAYIVFEEVPLEKFGNRIPQISVEAIHNETNNFPYEIKGGGGSGINGVFSPDRTLMYQEDGNVLYVWDVPTRTVIAAKSIAPTDGIAAGPGHVFSKTGGVTEYLWGYAADGGGAANLTPLGFGTYGTGLRYVAGSLLLYPATTNDTYYGLYGNATVTPITTSFAPTYFFEGPPGASVWACGVDAISEDNLTVARLIPNQFAPIGSVATAGGPAFGMYNGNGGILIWQADNIYLLDAEDPATVLAGPVAMSVPQAYVGPAFNAVMPGAVTMWIGFTEINTQTLEIIRTVNPLDWVTQSMTGGSYDIVNHALVTHEFGTNEVTWRYLDRIDSSGVQLRDVVDDVSDWCGLSGQDSSALTQTVIGYSVTQGSGKDMLAPLLDIHDVDARPHDFSVQFLNRGSASSGTLLTDDFVRNPDRYSVMVQQDTDIPLRLTFNFADEGKDQQTNTAISQRPQLAADSRREETIDLSTYVDTPDGAQQKGDRMLRRLWNSRERPKNALTHQALALEPGDVKTLDLDGVTRNVRLDKLTITPNALECEWVRDEITLSLLNGRAGATMDGRDPETIYIPGPTKGFILDAPLIQDADNDVNPILYYAAGGYTASWAGAAIYRGDDGTYDDLYGYVESTGDATWGIATEALASANPNLWDRGNTVEVQVYGTLTNATEAEIDADTMLNLCALGDDDRWEYIQFTTATLTGTAGEANVYTLSGLKRGRRGTEGNVGNHADGDQFLVLSAAIPTEIGTDEIGNDMSFKAQSPGRNVDGATTIDLTYDGNTLKPYAPASLKMYYDGTDLQCTITRRTRVGGAWNGGSTIPLSENSEEYEVDVYNGSTLKRTITVSDTNTFTYTSAMATADGITLPALPTFNVYQMSDTAGRGFALAA